MLEDLLKIDKDYYKTFLEVERLKGISREEIKNRLAVAADRILSLEREISLYLVPPSFS